MTNPLHTIDSRLEVIAKARKALDTEEQELLIARRVFARLDAATPTGGNGRAHHATPGQPALTHKGMLIATLRSHPSIWLESPTVLHEEIVRVHGTDIPKTSFQPLLSNLKKDGLVARDGLRIALAERAQSKEVAE